MRTKKFLAGLMAMVLMLGTMMSTPLTTDAASAKPLELPFGSNTLEFKVEVPEKGNRYALPLEYQYTMLGEATWGDFKKQYSNLTISNIVYTGNSESLDPQYFKIRAYYLIDPDHDYVISEDDYVYSDAQALNSNSELVWNFKETGSNYSDDTEIFMVGYVITVDYEAIKNFADGTIIYVNREAKYRTVSGTKKFETITTDDGQKFVDSTLAQYENNSSNLIEGTINNTAIEVHNFEDYNLKDKITVEVTPKDKKVDTSKWILIIEAFDGNFENPSGGGIFSKPGVLKLETTLEKVLKAKGISSLSENDLLGIGFIVGNATKNATVDWTITFSPASASTKLPAPTGIKTQKTAITITLSWNAVSGADAYRISLYNKKAGKYEKYKTVSGTKCTISALKSNTKYKIKITSLSKQSDGKYKAGKSKTVSVTTK